MATGASYTPERPSQHEAQDIRLLVPPVNQHVLQLAACIGNVFDLRTLSIICESSTTETAVDLQDLEDLRMVPQAGERIVGCFRPKRVASRKQLVLQFDDASSGTQT